MLKPEILKAKPAPDYDNLKRQFFALKTLCESKMHQCQIYSQKLAEYDRELLISSIEEINSQREMNAILTQENEQLRAENEKLRQQAEATNQTPEQSGVSVSDARQFDVRGYSWAIASNDGGVIASGSQPALAAKSETNTLGYLMDYSDRVGGDLYLAPTDLKNFDPIDTNNLIMGMTWDQLNAKQQGKALPSAIKSKMPSGAVKVYANGKLIGDSLSRQDASAESRKQKAKLSLQKGNQLRQAAKVGE